jgi:hypothetical protein
VAYFAQAAAIYEDFELPNASDIPKNQRDDSGASYQAVP